MRDAGVRDADVRGADVRGRREVLVGSVGFQ